MSRGSNDMAARAKIKNNSLNFIRRVFNSASKSAETCRNLNCELRVSGKTVFAFVSGCLPTHATPCVHPQKINWSICRLRCYFYRKPGGEYSAQATRYEGLFDEINMKLLVLEIT